MRGEPCQGSRPCWGAVHMVRKTATQGLDIHRCRHVHTPRLAEHAQGAREQIRASHGPPRVVSQATGSGHRPFVKSEDG